MIVERMPQDGQWLFRHRGVLPFVLLIPGFWAFSGFEFLGGSRTAQQIWDWCCLCVSISGLLVRATTVGFVDSGTSGRNTTSQRATELNTTGWYSVVRNPLYLGNYLVMLGIIMVPADIALIAITGLLFWIYYERIISAEEAFLHAKFGQVYADWARATPVFFPRLNGWRSPARTFRWKMVLRREYTAVLLIGIAFLALNLLEHIFAEQQLRVDTPWIVAFLVSLCIYATLLTLKRFTKLLTVC